MPICSVIGCTNRSYNKSKYQKIKENYAKISFHKFPKNPVRRQQWLRAINRIDWTPTYNSVICSEHFIENYFDRTSKQIRRLRENAAPTIFIHQRKILDSKFVLNFAHSIKVSNQTPILQISFDEDSLNSSDFVDESISNIFQHNPSTSSDVSNVQPTLDVAHILKVLLKTNELSEIKTQTSISCGSDRIYSRAISPVKQIMIKKIKNKHFKSKICILQKIMRKQKRKIVDLRHVLSNLRNQQFLPEKENPNMLRMLLQKSQN